MDKPTQCERLGLWATGGNTSIYPKVILAIQLLPCRPTSQVMPNFPLLQNMLHFKNKLCFFFHLNLFYLEANYSIVVVLPCIDMNQLCF